MEGMRLIKTELVDTGLLETWEGKGYQITRLKILLGPPTNEDAAKLLS